MFPPRYFPVSYFTGYYWPPGGRQLGVGTGETSHADTKAQRATSASNLKAIETSTTHTTSSASETDHQNAARRTTTSARKRGHKEANQ